MAIGDAADAAGMETLAGTEDLRESYVEHNRTRDYLAQHQTSGTHSASAITTGTLDPARVPTPSKLAANDETLENFSGQWRASAGFGVGTNLVVNVDATIGGTIDSPGTLARNVSGSGTLRQLYVNADGAIGHTVSSRRFKQDIRIADIPRATLRAVRVTFFRYVEAVKALGDRAPTHLGPIAEEIHDLGLTFLVDYEDGNPVGLNDRAMAYLGLLLAQDAEDRIDELTRTVYDLAAKVAHLEEGNS